MSAVFPINPNDRFHITTASEGQTVFAVDFPFQDNRDITVVRIDLDQLETTLNEGADYSLTGAGQASGGQVTLTAGVAAGIKISMIGLAVLDRLGSIAQGGKFGSKLGDNEHDRHRIIQQEHARDIDRALKVAFGTDPLKPLPVAEAGKALLWNGALDGFENGPTADEIADAQANATAAAASAAAAAASAAAAAQSQLSWVGDWTTATNYTAAGPRHVVTHLESSFVCIASHASSAATEPGVGASWQTVWAYLAKKGGGDVTSFGNNVFTGLNTFASGLSVTGDVQLSNALGDRFALWGVLGDAGSFAIGVESGTLYQRASSRHRWYLNTVADGGASDYMELDNSGLSVTGAVTTRHNWAGFEARATDALGAGYLDLTSGNRGHDYDWRTQARIDDNGSEIQFIHGGIAGTGAGHKATINANAHIWTQAYGWLHDYVPANAGWQEVADFSAVGSELFIPFVNLSGYRHLKLLFTDVHFVNTGEGRLLLSTDNGASFATTGYYGTAADGFDGVDHTTHFRLDDLGNRSFISNGVMTLWNFNQGAKPTVVEGLMCWDTTAGVKINGHAFGAHNALQISQVTGVINQFSRVILLGQKG